MEFFDENKDLSTDKSIQNARQHKHSMSYSLFNLVILE